MKRFEAGSNLPPLSGLESKPIIKKPEEITKEVIERKKKRKETLEKLLSEMENGEKPKIAPEAEQSQNNEAIAKVRENFKKLRNTKENPEHIPTSEEVQALFEKIVGEAKYETFRKLEDEQGLYLWEIRITEEDGGITEYEYERKGNYEKKGLAGGFTPETAIYVNYYDNDRLAIGGTSVLKLIDNKWVETP